MGKKYEIIDSYHSPKAKFEILQIKQRKKLTSFQDCAHAQLKQVRIKLNNGTVVTETGAIHGIQGQIRSKDTGIFKKIISKSMPAYQGRGEIYLEPSSCHYMLHKLENEEIIIDEQMFHCCEASIEISAIKSSTNINQIKLKGTGMCVLQSPVPENQILKFELFNERLQIDSNCVILRSGTLQSSVDLSFKSLLQSLNLFNRNQKCQDQTFNGTGKLWITFVN